MNNGQGFRPPPWLENLFNGPQKSAHGPSLADYLEHPERSPNVTFRPEQVQPQAMVRQPPNPAAIMAAAQNQPQLQAPMTDPNSAPTAPGMALSALIAPPAMVQRSLVPTQPQPRYGPETFVPPQQPRHGLEPPDVPWRFQSLADEDATGMRQAMSMANAAHNADNRAQMRQETLARLQALRTQHMQQAQAGAPNDDGSRPSPLGPDTLSNVLASLVQASKAAAAEHARRTPPRSHP